MNGPSDKRINQVRKALSGALPSGSVCADEAVRLAYSMDSSRLQMVPDLVVWPASESEVVAVIEAAREAGVPVCPRGRGSATTGASLAESGGIALSTERMAAIENIDPATRTATVGPGVLNGELARALAARKLMWPPDPTSAEYCTVGGNVATAAAGPRGLKYGGVRENVLGLRAVSGAGAVLACGARVPKSVAGFDLARLIVGSEGALAVVTQATLKLVPRPEHAAAAVAMYESSGSALAAVARIMAAQATPSALEYVDEGCLDLVRDGEASAALRGCGALLMIEADGDRPSQVQEDLDGMLECAGGDGLVASARQDKAAALWATRKVLSQRLRDLAALKINEDIVVPVARLEEFVAWIQQRCAAAQIRNVNFGHAGVGNLHVNLLLDANDAQAAAAAREIVDLMMAWVSAAGGSISGEHGIGIAKRGYLHHQVDEATRETMLAVKRVFDPCGILNPGKLGLEESAGGTRVESAGAAGAETRRVDGKNR